jgi:CheY-like chemotaxis protein
MKESAISILIVEDELIVAEDLRRRLQGMGYEVRGVVTSGDEAIRRVGEMQPDLVVMDISLRGDMDGVEAAHRIREHYGTPVVYITGHGDPDTLQRAKSTPGFAFVLKPVEDREMQYILEMVLKREESTRRTT